MATLKPALAGLTLTAKVTAKAAPTANQLRFIPNSRITPAAGRNDRRTAPCRTMARGYELIERGRSGWCRRPRSGKPGRCRERWATDGRAWATLAANLEV